eukprot:jgi/Hompol1/891/HPOL_002595-RA
MSDAAAAAFDKAVGSLSETRLPVSASKITSLTKMALQHPKNYKHVVHSIEKFVQRCKPEYCLVGLYVIDSIVRASQKQFEDEQSNVYIKRFEEKLEGIFASLARGPAKDKERMKRVISIWIKGNLFNADLLANIDQIYLADADLAEIGSAFMNRELSTTTSLGSQPALLATAATAALPPPLPFGTVNVHALSTVLGAFSSQNSTPSQPNPFLFDYGDEDEGQNTGDVFKLESS